MDRKGFFMSERKIGPYTAHQNSLKIFDHL